MRNDIKIESLMDAGYPKIESSRVTVTNVQKSSSSNLPHSSVISSNVQVYTDSRVVTNTYSERSKQLKRNIRLVVSNAKGDSFVIENAKMELSGSKYIGIQQDIFTITLKNINLQAFSKSINLGYTFVRFYVNDQAVFAGSIKSITTSRENVVERTMTLNCLMRVTDLLSDIVSPITVNSSMNIWHVLEKLDPDLIVVAPDAIKEFKFDGNYTFRGSKKGIVEDIIRILNNQLNRVVLKDLPWIDYETQQDGTLSLWGPTDHVEVLNMQPWTGLTDTPTVNDLDISFNSIYKHKIVPGRVVKMNNAYFSTSGTDSAFVYAFDEQGLYVITEVAYSFSNYPWTFKCSAKARPLSKYQNFIIK